MWAKISGTGRYLPRRTLDNNELSTMVDTSDEWVKQRVGISERCIAAEDETCAMMGGAAAQNAIEAAGISADAIDLIVVATSTPDYIMPSMACEIQARLGISGCMAFDLNAACSGFVYALTVVNQFIRSGAVKCALVVGSERMSRLLNWEDRRTCVLFGDGAGAVILQADEEAGILSTHMHADGQHRDLLYVPNNLAAKPFDDAAPPAHLDMEGNKVFKHAVTMMGQVVDEALTANGLMREDIDWLVPHQANARIIQATAKKLGMPMEKVILTLTHHGNTSAASIGLALDVAVRDQRIKRGDLILLEAFGAGFVWGSVLIRF